MTTTQDILDALKELRSVQGIDFSVGGGGFHGFQEKYDKALARADEVIAAAERKMNVNAYHTSDTLVLVLFELARAQSKFPVWPTDPLHALAILGEEYGELNKAVLETVYEPHKSTKENIHAEAIQVAAMALRFLISLERYEYASGKQHQQMETE